MKNIIYTILFSVLPLALSAQIKYYEFMDGEPKRFPITLLHCNAMDRPPVVDGDLSDQAWKSARKITGFALTDRVGNVGKPAERQTEVYLLHDNRNLYIGFVCHEPEMDKVRAENTRYDFSDILYDDRIEILLDAGHDHKSIARLVVNSLGITYDTWLERPVQYAFSYLKGSDNWNTEWRARVKRYDDRWTGEIAIALDRFAEGGIKPGDTWGINIARDSQATFGDYARFEKLAPGREISALVPVFSKVMGKISDRWIEPILYADMVFDQNDIEVTDIRFHEAFANYNGSIWNKPQFFGDNPLSMTLRNTSGRTMPVSLRIETTNFDNTVLAYEDTVTLRAGEEKEVDALILIRDQERQVFELTLTDTATGRKLYNTSYDTRVPAFVEFDLAAFYLMDTDRVSDRNIYVAPVTVPGMMDGCALHLTLKDPNGKLLATDRLAGLKELDFVPCFTAFDKRTLAGGNHTINCRLYDRDGKLIGDFDQYFTTSLPRTNEQMYAEYAPYDFGGETGKSVTVHFPAGERFVFWENASYIPWWDLYSMGVTYEFMECWGYGNQGCNEPMQDKENRYSRPEIIENSPARVVVLWRYALSDPNYQIFHHEWVNEYYYLYPDGSGVREVTLWANSDVNHEVLQPQYIFPTGVIPEQMFADTAALLLNLKGEVIPNLLDKPVLQNPESTGQWSEEIMRIYLKDRKHPYLVWSKENGLFDEPVNNALIKGDVKRSMGGHWPMQMLNVDVYSVVGTSKPYHSWLGALQAKVDQRKTPNRWAHLIGLTDEPNDHLLHIADNWLNAPLPKVKGAEFLRFDAVQKAYLFDKGKARECTIAFDGAATAGVINPVFIFEGDAPSSVTVSISGNAVSSGDYKYSAVENDYREAYLVWLGRTVTNRDTVKVTFKYDR